MHTACNLGDVALLSFISSQPSINIDQQDLVSYCLKATIGKSIILMLPIKSWHETYLFFSHDRMATVHFTLLAFMVILTAQRALLQAEPP